MIGHANTMPKVIYRWVCICVSVYLHQDTTYKICLLWRITQICDIRPTWIIAIFFYWSNNKTNYFTVFDNTRPYLSQKGQFPTHNHFIPFLESVWGDMCKVYTKETKLKSKGYCKNSSGILLSNNLNDTSD